MLECAGLLYRTRRSSLLYDYVHVIRRRLRDGPAEGRDGEIVLLERDGEAVCRHTRNQLYDLSDPAGYRVVDGWLPCTTIRIQICIAFRAGLEIPRDMLHIARHIIESLRANLHRSQEATEGVCLATRAKNSTPFSCFQCLLHSRNTGSLPKATFYFPGGAHASALPRPAP